MHQKSADPQYVRELASFYGNARLVTFRFESVTITKSSFLMVIRRNLLNCPVSTDKVVMVICVASRQFAQKCDYYSHVTINTPHVTGFVPPLHLQSRDVTNQYFHLRKNGNI